ncbi:helix-turn-helix transcriptional regulator [Saccharothrix sp.]|uniref:helix-turn-helix transcriptional regulator n=1 Tax=Saccharothrix sp. TaxID=1873460 RepID=UPI002812537D|nr:helix-turn-helix transcriptional regulator [Saccharothrix sp.]
MSEGEAQTDAATTAAAQLAHEIRRLRGEARLSHQKLAVEVGYTRQYVSLAERVNRNLPSKELVAALDARFDMGGALIALRARAAAEQRDRRRSLSNTSTPVTLPHSHKGFDAQVLKGLSNGGFSIDLPPGRFVAGSTVVGESYPASDDGRVVVSVPPNFSDSPLLRRPVRGLVVGVTEGPSGRRLFGLDNRVARTRVAKAVDGAPLLIPPAYELDDLTLGVLWAVANYDDALLDDDSGLADRQSTLRTYARDARSSGGRYLGADLSVASRMWLGSDFCARHILRHVGVLEDVPAFWTREQRGEEASTWLLFTHKHLYLSRTAALFRHADTPPTRSFCVPPESVTDSGRPERILLLLTVALMEASGIRVEVCAEPEYSAVQGFALDQRRRAIVANWVGGDGIWQVDVTDHRPQLREFADAHGYAQAHSVIAGPTPAARLRAFADYLDLDWHWLTRRCAELGDYGTAGLAGPRSRLLSTTALDRACRFLGGLGSSDAPQ